MGDVLTSQSGRSLQTYLHPQKSPLPTYVQGGMKNMQKDQALGGPLAVRKKSDDGGSIKLSKGVEGHGSTLCLRSVAAVSNPMPVARVCMCVCA